MTCKLYLNKDFFFQTEIKLTQQPKWYGLKDEEPVPTIWGLQRHSWGLLLLTASSPGSGSRHSTPVCAWCLSLPAWTRPSWTLICVLLNQLSTWALFCLSCARPHCFLASPFLAVRIPGVSTLHLCSSSSPGLSTHHTPDEVWSTLHGMSHIILRTTFFEISSIMVNFMDMENELQEMTKFT